VGPSFGLNEGDYQVLNLPPSDQVSALASGSADAIAGPEPYLTMGEVENIGRVLVRFGDWDPSPNVLTVSRAFLEQRPDDVVKLLRSWQMALDLWQNEQDKAAAHLMATFQEAGYTKLTPDMVKLMMKPFRLEPDITPDFVDHMKKEAASMIAAGRLSSEPDWEKSVAPEMLEQARKS